MPVIDVARRFMLQLDHDTPLVLYELGRYEVSDEVAEHWYVKEHLVGATPTAFAPTPAQAMLLVEQAVRMAEAVDDQTVPPSAPPPGTVVASKAEVIFAGVPQSPEAKGVDGPASRMRK